MIDPLNVTNAARTPAELGGVSPLLHCRRGQESLWISRRSNSSGVLGGCKPFAFIRASDREGKLEARLRAAKLGKYSLLGRGFRQLASSGIDLARCTWEDLTAFPGIGIKTAKFFILHSRSRQMHGVLDTHVLGWMREHWARPGRRPSGVPTHSPQDAEAYRFWEHVYFGMVTVRHHRDGRTVDWARFDLDLWKERRGSAPPA